MTEVDKAIAEIRKKWGNMSIMKLNEALKEKVEAIPTGALSLDLAIGVNGIPKGRIVEMYGGEGSGKTTLCLSIVKQCQLAGGLAAYIDMENAMDIKYARSIGVDVGELLISQPDTGEQALDIAETLIKSGKVDLIVIDSVAAMVTKRELEGEMGDSHMAPQARMMGQGLRKLTGIINKTKTAVIFINQLRDNIGFGAKYEPQITPGGRALKFYASVRIKIGKREQIKGKDDSHIGNLVIAKITKNKVGMPFKEALFEIRFGKGVARLGSMFEAAVGLDVLKKDGNTYAFGKTKLGVGKDKTIMKMKEDKELQSQIERAIREKYEEGEIKAAELNEEEKQDVKEQEEKPVEF